MFQFVDAAPPTSFQVVVVNSSPIAKQSNNGAATAMTETDPKTPSPVPPPPPPPSSSSYSSGVPADISNGHSTNHGSNKFSGFKTHYNPPDAVNPDAATLRDQWRFAIKQYSRWYSHAWGTAILAGVAFFALGWVIKGENPLPSYRSEDPSPPSSSDGEKPRR